MLRTVGLKNEHVKGALVGVGVAALGFYLYKKNQDKVESYLRKNGINVPGSAEKNFTNYSMEELVETKERLEDLIAEKEMTSGE